MMLDAAPAVPGLCVLPRVPPSRLSSGDLTTETVSPRFVTLKDNCTDCASQNKRHTHTHTHTETQRHTEAHADPYTQHSVHLHTQICKCHTPNHMTQVCAHTNTCTNAG